VQLRMGGGLLGDQCALEKLEHSGVMMTMWNSFSLSGYVRWSLLLSLCQLR
jgi:hypothetical protein